MDSWKLTLFFILAPSLYAEGPIFKHKDQYVEREFRQAYNDIRANAKGPKIYTGSGAPSFTPFKTGDIYVSTTTSKVYISTANATSASWALMN